MGTHSTMCCSHELHEDTGPHTKICPQCNEGFWDKAVFFFCSWSETEICGKCTDENIQLEIDELGLEEFIKRFAPEQLTNA